jgi:hypothetical protein
MESASTILELYILTTLLALLRTRIGEYEYEYEDDPKWHLLPEKLQKILSQNVTVANDNKQVAFDAFVRGKYNNNGTKP